jgi:hypothetical protein
MVTFLMRVLLHWFVANENALAAMVTAGVGVFLVCCLGCSQCSRRDKDDLFRHRQV